MTVLSPSFDRNPQLDSWVRIEPDGTITICTGKVELGQGLRSAIARIAAEELDVSLERIRVQTADTASGPNERYTAGSMSMSDSGSAVRQAAAEARAALIELAAARLGVRAAGLEVEDGTISAAGVTTTYWELLGGKRFDRPVRGEVPLKPPDGYRFVGKPGPRPDLPGLVTGTTRFVQDLVRPNMVFGRVVRPPGPGARLESVDETAARGLTGVVCVVRDGSFLAVAAEREEQAAAAAELLSRCAAWSEPESLPSDGRFDELLLRRPARHFHVVEGTAAEVPDPPAEQRPPDGAQVLAAQFSRPLLLHGSIGPSAALAEWTEGGLALWSHAQGISYLRDAVAEVVGLAPDAVRVIHVVGPGCYGHNGADDVALDAALLARAVPGRPVLLKWSRSDEHAWEPFGAPAVVRIRAALDGDGRICDWSSDVWSAPQVDRSAPHGDGSVLTAAGHLDPAWPRPASRSAIGIDRNADPLYAVGQRRVVAHLVEDMPLRTSSLRSLGAYANVFAIESFMDELASAAGADPVEFRLAHLEDERARDVIRAAAERAGWSERRHEFGRGLGVGFARYKNTAAYAAVVVELEVDDATAEVRLERVVIAADAGQIVDPDGLANQLEGGVIQSASWTLKERVMFDRTRVTSVDWESYPIMTFSEVPEIETVLIDRPGAPFLGAGEATQGPAAAAIANAVCDAVGLRVRGLPLTADRLRAAAAGNERMIRA